MTMRHHSPASDVQARISGGHRLLALARNPGALLYDRAEFNRRAFYITPQFWLDTVMPALRQVMSDTVSQRLIAAARRAKSNAPLYGAKVPDAAAVCTEVFFDTRLCRPMKLICRGRHSTSKSNPSRPKSAPYKLAFHFFRGSPFRL